MKIILLERINKLGRIGDIINVKNGYARNFLLPKNKAIIYNKENKNFFEKQKIQIEEKNILKRNEASNIANKILEKEYFIIRTSGETGKLYGSVTALDIANVIKKNSKCYISRNQVILNKPIKSIGKYTILISLHPELEIELIINIVRSKEDINQ